MMQQKKSFNPTKTRIPLIIAILLLTAVFPAWGQNLHFDVSSSLDWSRGEFTAQTSFNLAQAGLRLPAGRLMAEETLQRAWPGLFRPHILSLRVDSDSTIETLVERGELSLRDLDNISLGARITPPSLSADMTSMIGRYTVQLDRIASLLNRHRRAIEPPRPLVPVHAANHTGIIIIADRELPIRGRNARALVEPCLFPKIWDTNMTLIYDRNMVTPAGGRLMVRYAAPENIFRPTPSGLEGELAALVGPRPLRILAREVFGIFPTDPVIDRNDALQILSSENNRRLLREGRVVIVLNAEILN